MKIVVCSDIHGNMFALEQFMLKMNTEAPDQIFFLGDVFGYYYDQNECLNVLFNDKRINCIKGNHDQYFLNSIDHPETIPSLIKKFGHSYAHLSQISPRNITLLKNLPLLRILDIDSLKIIFCHGSLDDPLEGRIYPDTGIQDTLIPVYNNFDYVFLGHTHHKMLRNIGSTVLCNSGSLGQQRDGLGCSYVVFDTCSRKIEFKVVEFNIKRLVAQIDVNDPDLTNLKQVLYRDNSLGNKK